MSVTETTEASGGSGGIKEGSLLMNCIKKVLRPYVIALLINCLKKVVRPYVIALLINCLKKVLRRYVIALYLQQ